MKYNCFKCGNSKAEASWDAPMDDPRSYICLDCSVELVTGKSWLDLVLIKADRVIEAKKILRGLDNE